jgi:hypothetical protein
VVFLIIANWLNPPTKVKLCWLKSTHDNMKTKSKIFS